MTHLERFDAWTDGEPKPGMTYGRAVVLALKLGHTNEQILTAKKVIRYWLAKNEDNKKANKTYWGKFFLTWLTPKSSRQTDRLAPSNFD